MIGELLAIAVEGAVDCFCGRPRGQNPYCAVSAADWAEAWDAGWADADHLLDVRGQEEASRWLAAA